MDKENRNEFDEQMQEELTAAENTVPGPEEEDAPTVPTADEKFAFGSDGTEQAGAAAEGAEPEEVFEASGADGASSSYADIVAAMDGTEQEGQTDTAVIPPRRKNTGIFAVLGVIIAALLIVIAVLITGNRPDFLNFGKEKETVVGKVNGEKITEGQLRVFLPQTESMVMLDVLKEQFGDNWQMQGLTAINSFDWDALNSDGISYADVAKNKAFEEAAMVHLKAAKARELGIGLTEDEQQQITFTVEQAKAQYGIEEFNKMLQENYSFPDAQAYADFYALYQTASKFDSEYQKDPKKFLEDEEKLEEMLNDETASAEHILIQTVDSSGQPLSEEEVAAAKAKAEEILARVEAGENFEALANEFSEDPGQQSYPAGYSFRRGEMVQEFEDAVFALAPNEHSGLVETDYGYHIIKRIVGLSELERLMLSEANLKKNTKTLGELKTTSQLQQEKAESAAADTSGGTAADEGTDTTEGTTADEPDTAEGTDTAEDTTE